ncbi:hypothetical protein EG328_002467 [Venturia inaequalis]|uniref:Uncharacterized protein n=1 Tax=Venturia inaequalis TaxID=5025 RepID=A0A8H3UU62_VENIN|nr:hypothetical protein EG328_002467 [Venturia inaequalis]
MHFTKFILLGSIAFDVSTAQCAGPLGAVASLVSTLPAAQSFCTSRFSRPPVTVTTTATTNTVSITAATNTITIPGSTLFTTSTTTSIRVVTVTLVLDKRAPQATTLATKAATQDARSLALNSLSAAAGTIASSICACITKRSTATSTIVVTPTATITALATATSPDVISTILTTTTRIVTVTLVLD